MDNINEIKPSDSDILAASKDQFETLIHAGRYFMQRKEAAQKYFYTLDQKEQDILREYIKTCNENIRILLGL